MKEVKSAINAALDDDQSRLIYHHSDGTRGTADLAKLARVGSTRTIFDLWQSWLRLGLGETIPVKGGNRFKRSFDIEDFGMKVPPLPEKPIEAVEAPNVNPLE
ncbi:MAG TPA: hypothetical protein VF944_04760 [Candidatus Bathyarchaeia archaeon]